MSEKKKEDLSAYESSLQDLAWAIAMSVGQFSLIFVRYNYSGSREQIMQRLREISTVEIKEIVIDKSVTRLFFTIQEQVGNKQPSSVMVFGLELVSDINQVLLSMNQIREEFRKNFHFPLVFWVNDEIIKKLIKLVPDFESWATTINFASQALEAPNNQMEEEAPSQISTVLSSLNQSSLRRLVRALTLGQGQFGLIIINCNYKALREKVLQQIQEQLLAYRIENIFIPKVAESLYRTIQVQIPNKLPQLLNILGLDLVNELDDLLRATNLIRDEFRKNFFFPIVLWVTDDVLQKLQRFAPDFASWGATPIPFEITSDELLQFLRQESDSLFAKLLQVDSVHTTKAPNIAIYFSNTIRQVQEDFFELRYAIKELSQRGISIEKDLEASIKFIFGLDEYVTDCIDSALQFFQTSFKYWQEISQNTAPNHELQASHTSPLLRQGLVSFYIGLCYCHQANRNPTHSNYIWQQAKEYFSYCLNTFESAERIDLTAQFIFKVLEVLEQLQAWAELEQVAQKSLKLHQIYGNHLQIACDYGFLVEVAVQEPRWIQAHQFAQACLRELDEFQESSTLHQGIFPKLLVQTYRLILVKALRNLGDKEKAEEQIKTSSLELRQSLENIEYSYDVYRYIRLLRRLRQLYFEEGKYLEALYIRQKLRSVEQLYGFSVFVGARRLQYEKEATNTTQDSSTTRGIALEIIASGRQRDIQNLIARISRPDQKLMVIHGQSGVGKSSTITAGLVPALQSRAIGDQVAVPIVIQVYTNWVQELGKVIAQSKVKIGVRQVKSAAVVLDAETSSNTLTFTIAEILEQLQEYAYNRIITTLIFDQFEEFFFNCTSRKQQQEFEDFVVNALNIAFVKVIFSLREDYLHRLLEFKHLQQTVPINENILDKSLRYQLNNFSLADAKNLIKELTERSQTNLEPALIDTLVEDLAVEQGEVRPVELQLVGAQLEAEKITTLEQYRQRGSKEELVKRYLTEVVKECGSELEDVAWLVLYLLTDKRGTRRFKTRRELEAVSEFADLEPEKLELLLDVLVLSGLVLLIPDTPEDRYQLVHDYLVAVIREKQESAGLVDIEVELRLTKGELIRALREQEIAKIKALNSSSQALLLSHDELGALLSAFEAGKQLQKTKAPYEVTLETLCTLRQAVYSVRECNRFQGHSAGVSNICFSPNGKTLASASEDGTIILWQLDGHQLKTFQDHRSRVTSVRFSPDRNILVSADGDGTLILWHLDGTKLASLQGHKNKVNRVNFNTDGKILASSSDDGKIKLWCFDNNQLQLIKEFPSFVHDFSFSLDSQSLIYACENGQVSLQHLDSDELLFYAGHTNRVTSISLSSDGKTLVSASLDGSLILWHFDGRKLQQLHSFNAHKDWITQVSFSPDGQMIASASEDGTVKLWSLDGNELNTFIGHKNKVTSIAFNPDGQMIASADSDGIIKIWRLNGNKLQIFQEHNNKVTSIKFCADGRTLASGSENGIVKLWHLNGTVIQNLQYHNTRVTSLNFSPDGQTLASADEDGNINFFNFNPDKLILPLIHTERISSVIFSPNGKTLAFAGEDGNIEIWSEDGANLQASYKYKGQVTSICFSSDNEVLISATGNGVVQLWRFNGNKLQELQKIQAHNKRVTSVCFNPKDQIFASASEDCTVKVWNLNGNELGVFRGHNQKVTSICFSPNGQIVASASEDRTVKLWSLNSKEVQTFKEHNESVTDICFSPDGQTLASASRDGTVILWNLNLQDLLTRASSWLSDYLNTQQF